MIAVGATATLLVAGGLWYALKRSSKGEVKSIGIVVIDDFLELS